MLDLNKASTESNKEEKKTNISEEQILKQSEESNEVKEHQEFSLSTVGTVKFNVIDGTDKFKELQVTQVEQPAQVVAETYNPFRKGLMAEVMEYLTKLVYAQNYYDMENQPSELDIHLKGVWDGTIGKTAVGKLFSDTKYKSLLRTYSKMKSMSDLLEAADTLIEAGTCTEFSKEHLFCEATVIAGNLLLRSLSSKVGCLGVSIGDIPYNISQYIVSMLDFSNVFICFDSEENANKFVEYMKIYFSCKLLDNSTKNSIKEVLTPQEEIKESKESLLDSVTESIKIVSTTAAIQAISTTSQETNTDEESVDDQYKEISEEEVPDTTESNEEGEDPSVLFRNDTFERVLQLLDNFRVYQIWEDTRSIQSSTEDNPTGYLKILGIKIKEWSTKRIESKIVKASTLEQLEESNIRLLRKLPRKFLNMARSSEVTQGEHSFGLATLGTYKVLQISLVKRSGVQDILLDSKVEPPSTCVVYFRDYYRLSCSFIERVKAEKFVSLLHDFFNLELH